MTRSATLLFTLILPATGNGVMRWGFGAKDMGAAGAFGGTSGDAIAALQINPALLSTFTENQWTLSARALKGDATFRRSGQSSRLGDAEGIYPDFALSWRPSDSDFTLGFGLSPVSALEAKWNYLDAPGGIGGISYGTIGHETRFTAIRLALAAAWQVNEHLSLGLSAGAVYSEIDFKAPFIFQTNPALAGAKVNLDMETDGWAPSIDFGAHYRPNSAWTLGAQVKLPVSLKNRGKAAVDYSAQLPDLESDNYRARAQTELPLTLGIGTTWQPNDRWSLGFWLDWHQWSKSYDSLAVNFSDGSSPAITAAVGDSPSDRVPLDWHDRFVFSIGSAYQLNDEWTVRGGYRYGKSPIPKNLVTPLNGAILEHALTLGASWQRDDWKFDFAYGYEFSGTSRVGLSGYRAGEYSNSSLKAAVQHLSLSVGRRF